MNFPSECPKIEEFFEVTVTSTSSSSSATAGAQSTEGVLREASVKAFESTQSFKM